MPELHFKGKEYVYNHHLNVPYRPLLAQPDKSLGEESDNLIIHGDNLHALKPCCRATRARWTVFLSIRPITPAMKTGVITTTSIARSCANG